MFRSIQDFINNWAYESSSTLKMFREIPDSILDNKQNEDIRSIRRLAWHITQTIPEMMGSAGIPVPVLAHDAPMPDTMQEIADTYKRVSDSFIEELPKVWNDNSLEETQTMYGEQWKKGFTLLCLSMHQAHHRGQLTVLMRLAGLKVPGVYGPAKEEWAAMGMQPMD